MTVTRTIEGATKRYIEYMVLEFDDQDQKDAYFVDSGLTYDGAAATTITGLDHLDGEQVQILADGAVHPPKTVGGGSITLDYAASVVHVGLGSEAKITSLPVVPQPVGADPRGRHRKVYRAMVHLHRSLGGFIGVDGGDMDVLVFRQAGDAMDTAPPLFTGIKELKFPGSYEKVPQVTILQDQPMPMTVLSIITEVDVGGP